MENEHGFLTTVYNMFSLYNPHHLYSEVNRTGRCVVLTGHLQTCGHGCLRPWPCAEHSLYTTYCCFCVGPVVVNGSR